MQQQILDILKSKTELSGWIYYNTKANQHELYLIGKETESTRQYSSNSHTIWLYVDKEVEGTKYTGNIMRSLGNNLSVAQIEANIDEAIFAASLALNPYYKLPEPKDNDETYQNADPKIVNNAAQTLNQLHQAINKAVEQHESVKLASAEVFLTSTTQHMVTSTGLDYSYPVTSVMMEAVLLSGEGENEVESHLIRNERFVEHLDVDNSIGRYAGYTKDIVTAQTPPSGKFDVIFTEEALETFFDYYVTQTAASAIYNKYGRFNPGDMLIEDASGDKLTLESDPTLPGGMRTQKYDAVGLLHEKFTVIKDNKFETIAADSRHAQYLNCPATGYITNICIKPGNTDFEDMISDNCFVLTRFSTFTPNSITGAFSGEIRHGLWYQNGKATPVKGGSVTGIMDAAMKNLTLSAQTTRRGNYFGPRYIKLAAIDIAGN